MSLLPLLCLAHVLIAADFTLVYVALPTLGDELGLASGSLQWVMHAYALAFGLALLPCGHAADRVGRAPTFAAGLLLLGGASLLAAFASGATVLVLARALQGLACALLFPSMLGLIAEGASSARERDRAVAVWSGSGPFGLAAGTILGGVLLDAIGWRGVFAAVAVACLLCSAWALAALWARAPGGSRVERADAAASAGLAASAAALLARQRNLRAGMALTALIMGTFMALPYFHTQLFQRSFGFDGMQTGLAFLVPCLAQAIGAKVAATLVARFGLRRTVAGALAAGSACMAALGMSTSEAAGFTALVPWLLAGSFAQGIAWAGTWIAISSSVPERDLGLASALASTTFQVGGAAGLAALVALAGTHATAALSPSALAAVAAREASFGAALGIAAAALVAWTLQDTPWTQDRKEVSHARGETL